MSDIDTWTSTGIKLIHHPEVVKRIRDRRKASPISLQVGPTSRCNLKCSFCSNANRTKHEDLHIQDLVALLDSLVDIGLKTVEWTGGGDPTMYEDINTIIKVASTMGLEQGMITNGILLRDKLTKHSLDLLKWVRVSVNSLEYVHAVELPEIKGTLGFSYVINEKTADDVMARIEQHAVRYQPKYVRVVTNCLATDEEQEVNNKIYGKMVEKWGKLYFYQPKVFERSEKCYWCYLKPFVLHDGYVYPCSSVVLNSDADGKFNDQYRWTRMEDLQDKYEEEIDPFPTDNCNHCVFKEQNDLIERILHPEMENFV
ncbi:radical SAM protein [Candidatus Pacearchaeota archaeon]|nr:radical SAM protein [Candidatus Pacearchaeota archaeon]